MQITIKTPAKETANGYDPVLRKKLETATEAFIGYLHEKVQDANRAATHGAPFDLRQLAQHMDKYIQSWPPVPRKEVTMRVMALRTAIAGLASGGYTGITSEVRNSVNDFGDTVNALIEKYFNVTPESLQKLKDEQRQRANEKLDRVTPAVAKQLRDATRVEGFGITTAPILTVIRASKSGLDNLRTNGWKISEPDIGMSHTGAVKILVPLFVMKSDFMDESIHFDPFHWIKSKTGFDLKAASENVPGKLVTVGSESFYVWIALAPRQQNNFAQCTGAAMRLNSRYWSI